MQGEPHYADMTIVQILEKVHGAEALFKEHGVDPYRHCGPLISNTRLYVAASTCWLEQVDGLLDKLCASGDKHE